MIARLRRLRAVWADHRGVSAIEFALVAPMLLVVYLSGFELVNETAVSRKLTDATVELANVTSQYSSMSASDVSNVLNASSQIMTPYSTAFLTITLSEITNDSSGNGVVTWSQSYNTTPLPPGSKFTLPSGFKTPYASYVVAQTTYTYQPMTIGALGVLMPLSEKIIMLPRISNSIPYTG